MKLRFSPTSPYVRKVSITAIETGLDGCIERIPTNPWDPGTDLPGDNPLGKVPTLITDGGEVLYDSPVICEYLDSLHDGLKLFPASGAARWTALRRRALADGITDATALRFIEEWRRPEEARWPVWTERQKAVIRRGLDAFEDEAQSLAASVTIGHVALGCALGYLDLRFPEDDWRRDHAALARWFETFSARRSMAETTPKDPA